MKRKRQTSLTRSQTLTTHGLTRSPEFKCWSMMKQRCYNENNPGWPNYGGRGIGVCQRWLESFLNFYADMGPAPGPGFQIDRFPDKNGNYELSNCRWANTREQQQNTRKNKCYTHQGRTHCISEWARILQLNYDTLRKRLKRGWSFIDSITVPAETDQLHHFSGRFKCKAKVR